MGHTLVVDDDKITAQIIGKRLRSCSITPLLTNTVNEAISELERHSDIDLIVTDIVMPELRGEDLIEYVRRHPVHNKVPIIVVSGYIGPRQVNDLLILGATRCLCKPLDAELFDQDVKRLIRPSGSSAKDHDKAWNYTEALKRVNDDRSLLMELVAMAQQEGAQRYESLECASKINNRSAALIDLYVIRSAFANIGAHQVAREAAQLERLLLSTESCNFPSLQTLKTYLHDFSLASRSKALESERPLSKHSSEIENCRSF